MVEGCGQRAGPAETGESERVDAGLAAAGQHDVGVAKGDEARCVAEGVRAGCTGCGGGVVGATEAVAHRDVPGAEVG